MIECTLDHLHMVDNPLPAIPDIKIKKKNTYIQIETQKFWNIEGMESVDGIGILNGMELVPHM